MGVLSGVVIRIIQKRHMVNSLVKGYKEAPQHDQKRHLERIEDRKERFISFMEKEPNISKAARSIGVTYHAVYHWRVHDPEFDKLVNDLINAKVDQVEESMFENAINEYDVDGKITRKADFMSGIAILKAYRPDKYGDKRVIEHRGEKQMIKVVPAFVEEAEVVKSE